MTVKDISFPTPQENILFDDVLFSLAESGQGHEVLRFWESREPFIIMGKISKVIDDLNIDEVMQDKIPVLRRSSGGGTVAQGVGCINYCAVLSKDKNVALRAIRSSYDYILGKIVASFKKFGINSVFKPISDIATADGERKFSGNAQRRGRKFIMHHGTVLYNFCVSDVERYLRIPKHIPEYRLERGHGDFLTNINLKSDDIKSVLIDAFGVSVKSNSITAAEQKCLCDFLNIKDIAVNVKKH